MPTFLKIDHRILKSSEWKMSTYEQKGKWLGYYQQCLKSKGRHVKDEHEEACRLYRGSRWGLEVNMFPRFSKVAEEDVEAIYEAYPRKVGRGAALLSIRKACVEHGAEMIMEKVKLYAKAREGEEKFFTPHAQTWMNQQRYLDDPEEWAVKKPEEEIRDNKFNI